MILRDVAWAVPVNVLTVRCEPCGIEFKRPSSNSLVKCPGCGLIEVWHGYAPRVETDHRGRFFVDPVMVNRVGGDQCLTNRPHG